jgi:hypothetical protein
VEDFRNALNSIDVDVAAMGGALRIKLGPNLYRIINPVPMRIAPSVAFGGLPSGTIANIVEISNIGFTVLFLPLSVPIEHFGLGASANP